MIIPRSTTLFVISALLFSIPRAGATTYLHERFEGGLGAHWRVPDLGGEGRVQLTNEYAVNPGGQSLMFDSAQTSLDSEKDLNEAILTVNLAGATRPLLTFQQLEEGDEDDVLGAMHVIGTGTNRPGEAYGDGLTVSNDGTNWYRIVDHMGEDINRPGDGVWRLHEYELVPQLAQIQASYGTNLAFTTNFMIKFSQYDDRPYPTDGWAIDKILLTDGARLFETNLEPNVFHRLNLPGVEDRDYYYRLALFGDVGSETPIMVSVHGASRTVMAHTRRWQRLHAEPTNGFDDIILIAPYHPTGGLYNAYQHLSWNTVNSADASEALLETVAALTNAGFGCGAQLYLYGFSGGGQYVGRFTWARPGRVAAAVIGGAGSQCFPDPYLPYYYGFGPSPTYPAPTGVSLDLATVLPHRIMWWVGDADDQPDANLLPTNVQASIQGAGRLHRTLNMFEKVYEAAEAFPLDSTNFEFELFVDHIGHSVLDSDALTFYEFLFRDTDLSEQPLRVYPRVVSTPSSHDRQVALPDSLPRTDPLDTFYLELWVTAPGTSGVARGAVDVVYDTQRADAVALEHGTVFTFATAGTIDDAAGRVLAFGGETPATDVGVNEYALLGRVQFQTLEPSNNVFQLALGIMRSTLPFALANGANPRTELRPVPRMDILTNLTVEIRGSVYEEFNGNAHRDADEPGLETWTLALYNTDGTRAMRTETLDANDYETGAFLNKVLTYSTLGATGPGVAGLTVVGFRDILGFEGFAYQDGSVAPAYWHADRQLRIDFHNLADFIQIDATGGSLVPENGVLEAYDEQGGLLDTTSTAALGFGATATLSITNTLPSIAYAIAYGGGANGVLLDNLTYRVELVAEVNSHGHYVVPEADAGSYLVVADAVGDYILTEPPSGTQAVMVAAGGRVEGVNFASAILDMDEAMMSVASNTAVLGWRNLGTKFVSSVQAAESPTNAWTLVEPANQWPVPSAAWEFMPNSGAAIRLYRVVTSRPAP